MKNLTVEIDRKQVINALSQLSSGELKKVIDTLFRQKIFAPPALKDIIKKADKIVKHEKLKIETVEEAKLWARSQK